MSEPNSLQEEKLSDVEEERKFWKIQRNLNIFNLFVQGEEITSIATTLGIRPLTIESLITNKYFVNKLEKHLRGVVFTNQVSKVIAASDIFNKLWDKVRNNIDDIPAEICLKELTKLFPSKKEGLVINPKNLNVFMQTLDKSTDPEDLGSKLIDLDEDMGYEGLADDDDADYPELNEHRDLGEGEQLNGTTEDEDGDKRGDHPLDQKEQDQNQQRTSN